MLPDTIEAQHAVCRKYGVAYHSAPPGLKVGAADNVRGALYPLNGLRHPPAGDTTGWYIWRGEELSSDPAFFKPLHVAHLGSWCPDVLPYLGLPPGWRFLLAPGYVDVWYDASLLDV
jgi:hypothetical protein